MKVLLTIPHVFAPLKGSLYSSQNELKRGLKTKALHSATVGNIDRHSKRHWIHASLGLGKSIVTRELSTNLGVDIRVEVFTPSKATLASELETNISIHLYEPNCTDYQQIPLIASRHLLEQAPHYDLLGYMEDDILIEDPEFFSKILYFEKCSDGSHVFIPHRCENIPGKGDVILSGDPDGGRPDLFWDTGELINIPWPLGERKFYRATNPHSGCYFLTKTQASKALAYWEAHNWTPDFELSGPLEQAGSGLLLPIFKVMKPIPEHYRFLMVRHQDRLWERHPFESSGGVSSDLISF
ncbi:hypothetical protein [Prochlorococcus sp. MIT 1300]|uniref:hypothetical protein n=1 Tax=Prochlorococcus sp. MIT 1300 TaxID=3096218 RepID=UPI002A75C89E|nr:hypothetical protein [Prochlorococcus sp. MIT 1300]